MKKVQAVAPQLCTMTFISMSKSISQGYTTAGTIIAGPADSAVELLKEVRYQAKMLDTTACPD